MCKSTCICCDVFKRFHHSTLHCGHAFHDDCLSLWFQNNISCPLCESCNIADFTEVYERVNIGKIPFKDDIIKHFLKTTEVGHTVVTFAIKAFHKTKHWYAPYFIIIY
ncbi:hypothetical protein B4U80_15090 [Leptotrombidium deliense]|uniref:RING-type domain-containing protein n=1 Tax=Leptotrombidium deliense TaxID=299467 RepID=A0A443Q8E7_9ACAR|nr:hypothetical protein B4U80_15090 [Leptotrombidium deliense]